MNSKKTSRVIYISSVGETWYGSEWVSCKVCWDALRELVPFVLFKKNEKNPWIITFSNTPPWVFHVFKIVQILSDRAKYHIQWNLCIADTYGTDAMCPL